MKEQQSSKAVSVVASIVAITLMVAVIVVIAGLVNKFIIWAF